MLRHESVEQVFTATAAYDEVFEYIPGNIKADITATMVIAAAARLIEVPALRSREFFFLRSAGGVGLYWHRKYDPSPGLIAGPARSAASGPRGHYERQPATQSRDRHQS